MQSSPPGTLDEPFIIYKQLNLIQTAENPDIKMERIEDLEILLEEYHDQQYQKDLDKIEEKFQEAEQEAKEPIGKNNKKIYTARYRKAKRKWKALMGVINRAGLKPPKDVTARI